MILGGFFLYFSVVDRHRFYADPDPNPTFHFDADPDSDPDWHQNSPDPHAGPNPIFIQV